VKNKIGPVSDDNKVRTLEAKAKATKFDFKAKAKVKD